MPDRTILLFNEDPTLSELVRQQLSGEPLEVIDVADSSGLHRTLRRRECRLALIERRKDWLRDLKRLERRNGAAEPLVIVGSADGLRRAAGIIRQLSAALAGSEASRARRVSEAVLSDLVEGKLSDFVRRMKAGGGRDLHGILMREIERPLITLVLKETNGNQIKAAQMLGMNRNTLRKKIRALQITVRRPAHAR